MEEKKHIISREQLVELADLNPDLLGGIEFTTEDNGITWYFDCAPSQELADLLHGLETTPND